MSVPTSWPSTRKSTWSTAVLSEAAALRVAVPLRVAPVEGLVRLTVGGVVSPGVTLAALESTRAKSSIVSDPVIVRPIPTERLVAPDGTAGVFQLACVQLLAAANFADCDQYLHSLLMR